MTGILRNKTRVFVTNSLSFLPQVDSIIMLENGSVTETGTFEELKSRNGSFAKFIHSYLENNEANKENIKNDQEEEFKNSLLKKKSQPLMSSRIDSLGSGSLPMDSDDDESHELQTLIVGERLIAKESFVSGSVKLSVLVDYVRKCGVALTTVFSLFFAGSIVALAASSFWLSEWSNDANARRPDRAHDHRCMSAEDMCLRSVFKYKFFFMYMLQ
jgi:hypothetical protein